jgi:(E)-4-hydroxy-3-methylbut-2-enyl-diphosphate synthase
MAKASPQDVGEIVAQLKAARQAGCGIARVAVPDLRAAERIEEISEGCGLPIVADVHFDHRLAVAAARHGAAGLRINPGNFNGKKALSEVVAAAGKAGISIRVGVNAGSLPACRQAKNQKDAALGMVDAALVMVDDIEHLGFFDLKVSLKASDAVCTQMACRSFAGQSDLPIHLGLTEAGPVLPGAIRSSLALGPLLEEGIGDTLRLSFTSQPVVEVRAAKMLLQALGLANGAVLVACPTCGRTSSDLCAVAERIQHRLDGCSLKLKVAVMGCEVNGPGEAKTADLGIAFGPKGQGALFVKGLIVEVLPNLDLEDALLERLENMEKKAESDNNKNKKKE